MRAFLPALAAVLLWTNAGPALAGCSSLDPAAPCPAVTPIGVLPSAGGLVAGCGHTYALSGDRAGAFLLDLPSCAACASFTGAAELRCRLTQGCSDPPAIGQSVAVLRGHGEAVVSAMEERFAADTDQRSPMCRADYHGNGSRLVVLPVVASPGARGEVTIVSYATFFLVSLPGPGGDHTVLGEFVGSL